MDLTRLVAAGVLTAAIASLTILWGLFGTMWAHGETQILLDANRYNEFLLELALLTLAMIFLPVLLYKADHLLDQ
ncbi:hypothetical protein GRX01_12555 [Halobaculum sp. WSA2]|uniref:Uncharacterized protein n=1 Tax=Halobaculum saliterrae TaxID=2073113 RepID=A0A6B0SXB3_9EURY|nr:hypothetical protein [Halobaculum saliterrae]MXR42166.1 hypothetical protein [Halobaculum saliterrae]